MDTHISTGRGVHTRTCSGDMHVRALVSIQMRTNTYAHADTNTRTRAIAHVLITCCCVRIEEWCVQKELCQALYSKFSLSACVCVCVCVCTRINTSYTDPWAHACLHARTHECTHEAYTEEKLQLQPIPWELIVEDNARRINLFVRWRGRRRNAGGGDEGECRC